MKKRAAFLFILLLPFSLFSQRILSPVEGVFANWQPLVVNLKEGEEAFYSYSASGSKNNPLDSGFAYDGPVLIDQSGQINLKIAVVDSDKNVERYEIKYRVQGNSNPFAEGSDESSFVSRIQSVPLISLSQALNVPPSLKYAPGDGNRNFLGGSSISLSSANCLARLVPFSVTDGKSVWRFIVNVRARSSERLSGNENFPFKISNWNKVEFTGQNLIWQLDDGYWSASHEPFLIDRSASHILRWQSVAYEDGNPVESFVLPPKPELEKVYDSRAAVFSLKGIGDYKMQIVSAGNDENPASENDFLYSQIVFDAFEGEKISGRVRLAVFCGGVFQGFFSDEYDVDKEPPLPPEFEASAPGFYARSDVSLKISAESGAKIFCAFTGPHALDGGNYSENSPALEKYHLSDFKPYNHKTFLLRAGKNSAVFYKFASYAVDNAGNKSQISQYKLIIDKFNYFIDFSSAAENPDGSGGRPLNKMEQVLKIINSSDYSHFFVTGNFHFSGGGTLIKSNCAFTGTGSAKSKITFDPDSFLTVKNSNVSFSNCLIEKNFLGTENSDSRMIVLESAAANFDGCLVYGNFSESGILINSFSSAVNLKSSQISTQSSSYSCVVSALKSEVEVQDCGISCSSQAAAAFSVSSSSLSLKDSSCAVFCKIGRAVESEKSNLKMAGNEFRLSFEERRPGQSAVYRDAKTLIIEDSENKTEIESK